MDIEKKTSWLERVEDLIQVLEGSSIGELELTEDGTEIVIRRRPGMVMTPIQNGNMAHPTGQTTPHMGRSPARQQDQGVPIIAPMTGVYYTAASPTSPQFVNVGDIVQVGQVVALIEAMKVFNEISAEVAGRVIAMVATNGVVVQKGDVLLRVEPI